MNLQEPKIEIVLFDQEEIIVTSGDVGGGQRCVGSQPDAAGCADWDSSIPWN